MNHLTDERAQELIDGALPDAVRRGCELHVARCAECQALVESFRALAEALDGLEAPLPPQGFTSAVMARIDEAERARSASRRLAAAIGAAAAVLAVAFLALAGVNAWAPALVGVFDRLGGVVTTLSLVSDVASPLLRVLRMQIVVACLAVGVPLLYALSRLVPRGAEVSA